jgi:endonuclease/exonuclease/phosphatase (EEP) superfamily protein YafD
LDQKSVEWDIDQMVKKSNKVKKVFIFGIWLILAGFAFVAAIILLKLRTWPFELFHHFVLHYLLLTVPLMVLCLFLRAKKEAALFSALFILFGISLWGAYGAPRVSQDRTPKPSNNHQELTLISHNIKDSNKHHQKLGLWLQSQPADVVLLQEVPSRIAAWYKEERFYPYQLEVYDPALNHPNFPDDKAIVILSKYIISEELEFKPSKDSRPVPLVRIDVPDAQGPWIAVIDALEPKTAQQLGRRDQLLLKSAKKIGEQNGLVVVAGDFNATPLTPIFREFLKTADLSAPKFYSPTFPSKFKWLGIPIDHILVRNIEVKSIEALPAIGSDHRPLKAQLLIPR